jgi:hypothetical protein
MGPVELWKLDGGTILPHRVVASGHHGLQQVSCPVRYKLYRWSALDFDPLYLKKRSF